MDRFPSEQEKRRRGVQMLFNFELMCIEEDYRANEGEATLHYDERNEVFRFSAGTFVLSREYANWRQIGKFGYKHW